MENFWDYSVWGTLNVVAVLLASLLVGNVLKKSVVFLKDSLIPISVIGGGILIFVAWVYKLITGEIMFDSAFFGASMGTFCKREVPEDSAFIERATPGTIAPPKNLLPLSTTVMVVAVPMSTKISGTGYS